MPTVASSTETPPVPAPPRGLWHPRLRGPRRSDLTDAVRAVVDVGHLLRFRRATMRRRGAFAAGMTLLLLLTATAATVPALTPGAGGDGRAFEVLLLLPTALGAFLALAVVSATASGGGRELLARDPAAVHPVSPTTDHLGALLLAPLNIAWLLQVWMLLGTTAYALGWRPLLVGAQAVLLLWVLTATAVAQAFAWALESARRLPHGVVGVRALVVGLLGAVVGLQVAGQLVATFDRIPTQWVVIGMITGDPWVLARTLLVLLGAFLLAVVLGAVPAHVAAHRVPRDEIGVEGSSYGVRRTPRTDLGVLLRTDRASVWRAVPMRRGITVLALGPALVAVIGNLPWSSMTVLPGLVASGGALLFGVNAWCLDGRGALWRESLPVTAAAVFAARAWVLAEFLLVASLVTVAVAALRAGLPTAAETAALVCTVVVVTVQVVAASMRWSAARPYAVDFRSARATPAPPLGMVGYSARLAISTTFTGLLFSGLSRIPEWRISVLVALPLLIWSAARLHRAYRRWLEPDQRARVVTTVAV
ncbi:hypothetical protein [Nocardioides nanhaiensis]|uniref:ABC-2 type transport system permease protein n=1 Tax=Nocardioides nanhaiensis TaxID=1476871 RepID=A0ABP8VQR3_9ACTN